MKRFLIASAIAALIFTGLQNAGATTRSYHFGTAKVSQNGNTTVENFTVDPGVYDPGKTNLVQATWLIGIGCPTNASSGGGDLWRRIHTNGSNNPVPNPNGDPGCPTTDPKDNQNMGLLLVKTGPTTTNAAAGANINGLPKTFTLTELGWDIRSSGHCGAGSPRYDVFTTDNTDHFFGCASATVTASSNGWRRLRWTPDEGNPAVTTPVAFVEIVADEGQDTGSDFSGLSVLDNIDINGIFTGK